MYVHEKLKKQSKSSQKTNLSSNKQLSLFPQSTFALTSSSSSVAEKALNVSKTDSWWKYLDFEDSSRLSGTAVPRIDTMYCS